MLAALFTPAVLAAIFTKGAELLEQYQQKQITLEQLKQQLGIIAMQEATKVEVANADMVARTYAAFSEVLKFSPVVRFGWLFVVVTQASVLAFYQLAVPLIVWEWGGSFPSPGDQLLEWGYGILVLLVGGGAVAIRRPAQPKPKPSA
jgi:hypothetical protein